MSEAATLILEARNVNFSYRNPVVCNVSLKLVPGAVTGIIGLTAPARRLSSGCWAAFYACFRTNPARRRNSHRHACSPGNRAPDCSRAAEREQRLAPDGRRIHHARRSPHLARFGFEGAQDEEITMSALEMTQLTRHSETRVRELSGGRGKDYCWRGPWPGAENSPAGRIHCKP